MLSAGGWHLGNFFFEDFAGGAIMKFKLKDPGSAITHGIAFLLAAVGAAPLLIRSSVWSDHIHMITPH